MQIDEIYKLFEKLYNKDAIYYIFYSMNRFNYKI